MAEIAGYFYLLDKAYKKLKEKGTSSAETAIKPEEIGIHGRMALNGLKSRHKDVRETEDVKIYIEYKEENKC
jgi:hypothetical protein